MQCAMVTILHVLFSVIGLKTLSLLFVVPNEDQNPASELSKCPALAIRNATAEQNGIVTRSGDKTEFWVVRPSAVILGEQWIAGLSAVFHLY